MLLSNRTTSVPELGSRFGEHMLLHTRYRLFLSERIGITVDENVFAKAPRLLDVDRYHLLVVLEGEVEVSHAEGELLLRTGDTAILRRSLGWRNRMGGKVRTLLVEWEPGSLGTRWGEVGTGPRLGASIRQRLIEASDPLASPQGSTEAAACLASILEVLRAEGFSFDRFEAQELIEEVPEPIERLSRSLDHVLSSLADRPMLIDLEQSLGWSRRHVHRMLADFHERYAFHMGGSWRQLLQVWRLFMGAALMSADGAKTERVAQLLGYSSVSTFCDAFTDAGLPSPSSFRELQRRRPVG